IYRPYMPKRRNKAQIAKEAGLEPLSRELLDKQNLSPDTLAAPYINAEKGIENTEQALEGAKQILMEFFSEDTQLNSTLRDFLWQHTKLQSQVIPGKEQEGEKFSNYFDAIEAIDKMPSHRALALFRGRNEGFLQINLLIDEPDANNTPMNGSRQCISKIIQHFTINTQQPTGQWLADIASWTWKVKLSTRLDTELKLRLKEYAEQEAINVFSQNLNNLLMAAPAGPQITLGLDPGYRSGVKVAVIDDTGKYIDDAVIYPHQPQNQYQQAINILVALIKKHKVKLVSIGNGTASRETDRLVNDLIKQHSDLSIQKIIVSEAGASVYSASEVAAEEFPELDVTIRGAISIARRLQDPLAELVKIDPKSIGVGQYQHDVNQSKLGKGLHNVVEDCVNSVGVDVNMASAQLLSYVSGFNKTLAKNVIAFRDANGPFSNRSELKKVTRLGNKAFEQSAGFLRIMKGDTPLDSSSVHPESYPLVKEILHKTQQNIHQLMGNQKALKQLNPQDFVSEQFGLPTINDILAELEKPGRDPRPDFKSANFKEGVEKISDLKTDMILEGVVTNITNFGAFVD
ncbi:MAG TPA: RNA-binding transcriptional accessory protein, partial [Gammaproteobacteria bacterium]|nr:RNA-binding transcriptional accessory protein [Gammaproteobacteria bacterium]